MRHLGHVAMKGRVEAGHLRQAGIVLLNGPNGLQFVRQMLGHQADDLVQADQHLRRNQAAAGYNSPRRAPRDGPRRPDWLAGKSLSREPSRVLRAASWSGSSGCSSTSVSPCRVAHAEDAAAQADPLDLARQHPASPPCPIW